MLWFFLFLFGAAIGSFLNVVALRYNGERFLFDPKEIGGRSHCPKCHTTLRWFELTPLLSFIIQRGKCRTCGVRIGFQYPLVELISGFIFLGVPLRMAALYGTPAVPVLILSAFWIAAFEILLLISYIDIRLGIIPDELNIFLMIVGIFGAIFAGGYVGNVNQSFLGPYSLLLGAPSSLWASHIIGGLFGVAFFGLLVIVTRGKGIGMGDVKLAFPLGFLFGWPDMLLLSMLAFVIGAVVGVGAILVRRKTMKGTLPFGPFLAISGAVIFFYGFELVNGYLNFLVK